MPTFSCLWASEPWIFFQARSAIGASSRHGYQCVLLHPRTFFPGFSQLIEINLELGRSGLERFPVVLDRLVVSFAKSSQIASITAIRLALERKMKFRWNRLMSATWSG